MASPTYNKDVNKYKVKCGASLETWEKSGWIREQDPYGWFQWYCRFYQVCRNFKLIPHETFLQLRCGFSNLDDLPGPDAQIRAYDWLITFDIKQLF